MGWAKKRGPSVLVFSSHGWKKDGIFYATGNPLLNPCPAGREPRALQQGFITSDMPLEKPLPWTEILCTLLVAAYSH